jgi:hypothetical protein
MDASKAKKEASETKIPICVAMNIHLSAHQLFPTKYLFLGVTVNMFLYPQSTQMMQIAFYSISARPSRANRYPWDPNPVI